MPTEMMEHEDFKRDDFGKHGKKRRALVVSPKKRYDPLVYCKGKLLNLTDVAEAVKDIETDLILRTAVPNRK